MLAYVYADGWRDRFRQIWRFLVHEKADGLCKGPDDGV
jgi:hypothetical protein